MSKKQIKLKNQLFIQTKSLSSRHFNRKNKKEYHLTNTNQVIKLKKYYQPKKATYEL